MRLFGKERSKSHIVLMTLLIPVAIVGLSPLLMMGLFLGNDLAGVVFGPPAIWSRPWHLPSADELSGDYSEKSRSLDSSYDGPKARLVLRADGTMRVKDLPYEQMNQQHCLISGTGSWSKSFDGEHLDLRLDRVEGQGVCPPDRYGAFSMAGHGKPYSLYWIVSDPDSGTGVWLASNR